MALSRSFKDEYKDEYKDERGQATVEYILMLTAIVAFYVTIASWVNNFGLAQKLLTPISKDFAATYQYGDPKAAGFDSDTPKNHPRIVDCDGCFRLFINPKEH